jgi:hypothetical protein
MQHRTIRPAVRRTALLACAVLLGSAISAVAADPAAAAIGSVRGAASGRCLDVPGGSTTNGTQVSCGTAAGQARTRNGPTPPTSS